MIYVKPADSHLKLSSYTKLETACLAVGEENIVRILSIIESSEISRINDLKESIINITTSKFNLDNNFFRKKSPSKSSISQTLCFAVILFYLAKEFKMSYRDICRDLKIKPKNTISYYQKRLNSLSDDNKRDAHYKKIISEVSAEIKLHIDNTLNNNTLYHGQKR